MASEVQRFGRPPAADGMPTHEGVEALSNMRDGAIVRRTGNQYSTALAVSKPRKLAAVIAAAEEEAAAAGDIMYYAWGAGDNHIEGPSKQLAFAAVRLYGNAVLDMDEVQDLGDSWIMTARFVDLETGFTMTRQFRQSKKSVVAGRMDEERKMDIRFQNGQTRAARNVVLNALPGSLIANMMEAAKGSVRGDIETLIGKHGLGPVRDKAIKSLEQFGAVRERILARLGVENLGQVAVEHLVTLKGCLKAIEIRETTVDECFPPIPEEKADPKKGGVGKSPAAPATEVAKAPPEVPSVPDAPPPPPEPAKPTMLPPEERFPSAPPIARQGADNLLGEPLDLPSNEPEAKKRK